MGHWSDFLLGEMDRQFGGTIDHDVLADLLSQAGHEVDVLAGRAFNPAQQKHSIFEPNGLPFADLPDLLISATAPLEGAWAIPDPVDPTHAAVLQLAAFQDVDLVPRAAHKAEALRAAGHIVAQAYREGGLSREFVLLQLGSVPPEARTELLRRAMDPEVRMNIPISAVTFDGWLIQITRRLVWANAEDEGRLFELLDESADNPVPLMAVEPVLIMAPMTHQPVQWAFTARLWTEKVQVPTNRPWSRIASAIHGHGIPTITLDSVSSPQEIACQLVLKAYWHGYIAGDEPALANAVAAAYPQAVERIERGTHAPSRQSAAATLLEGLVRPGFNPAQGAEATRRYVRRKASIAVMEHRKRETPDRYPWTQVGISERRYYKLLPLFAQKVNGRYDYNHDEVVARMRAHLNQLDRERKLRTAAMEVLVANGFGHEAARKWLQRHRAEEALTALPRRTTGGRPTTPERPTA